MGISIKQQIPLSTLRLALSVTTLCYLPHILTAPWWLTAIAFFALAYRMLASFYNYGPTPSWIKNSLVLSLLFLLIAHYKTIWSNDFYVSFLLSFIWLKVIELNQLRDLKILSLCNFYMIFTALILNVELWILFYMIAAVFANMVLMLKLDAPSANYGLLSRNSINHLLIAIPISLFMFYFFPRLSQPLWSVPSPIQAKLGFSEEMSPGTFSQLFSDERLVMRVTFTGRGTSHTYFRGLILSRYDGRAWKPEFFDEAKFQPLNPIAHDGYSDYEVLMEPQNKKWLFYADSPASAKPRLKYAENYGLMRLNGKAVRQRFAYSLKTAKQSYTTLSRQEYFHNTKLPPAANPKLRAWAKQQMRLAQGDLPLFLKNIKKHIRANAFWYRLAPQAIGQDGRQMDRFWFATREGYCEHYASAVTIVLRAAGIPARVIVGYQGGEWNPIAHYLAIRQKDAHAWLQYWQPGLGWRRLDPITFIHPSRIDQSINSWRSNRVYEPGMINWANYRMKLSWLEQAKYSLESARYFWERWLLFYNQDSQQRLMQLLGLGHLASAQLLQITIISLLLFLFLFAAWLRFKASRRDSPLKREYYRLQQQLQRFHVQLAPKHSLRQLISQLEEKRPQMKSMLSTFINDYEALRLQQNEVNINRKPTLVLLKKLRKKLKKIR